MSSKWIARGAVNSIMPCKLEIAMLTATIFGVIYNKQTKRGWAPSLYQAIYISSIKVDYDDDDDDDAMSNSQGLIKQ